MPVLQRIIPSRSKEFWDSLDPENMKQVLEAVKEEVNVKKIVRLTVQDLNPISISSIDQNQHTSFTILGA